MSWNSNDILNAKSLNKKTIELIDSRINKRFSKPIRSAQTSPDLVFRQENSSFPAVSESFPVFHIRRPIIVLGIFCYSLVGEHAVTLKATKDGESEVDLVSFDHADTDIQYLPDTIPERFLVEGDILRLTITENSGDVEDFQANVILRVVG